MVELTITEKKEKDKDKNKKPTLCLNMIVKNEANVIVGTLNNLTRLIEFDYWVISDTGSTDNTQQIIRDYFLEKGIPGELVSHEWKDFGFNRTKALESAYDKTDYLLIFDADDALCGDFKLPFDKKPYADRYMLKIGKGFEYMRPLLINNRKRWMFKGVLHEFLSNLEPVNNDQSVIGNYHIDSGRTGNRSQNPHKYRDDAIILKNAYEKELTLPDKGLSGRYAFYCARSYKDAGEAYRDDAIHWYKKVLDIPNHWAQEKYYSALEIGCIYKDKKQMDEAVKYFLKTIEYDNERLEGLIIAIEYFSETQQHILVNALYHKFKLYKQKSANLSHKLFVNMNFYNDRLEFYNGISAYYVDDKQAGYDCCKQVLLNNLLGQHEIKIIINNLVFYNEVMEKDKDTLKLFHIIDELLYKNNDMIHNSNVADLWTRLFKQNKPLLTAFNKNVSKTIGDIITKDKDKTKQGAKDSNEKILITFTTCKRLDLFKETINSVMNHWTDINKITHWFCVDDNSSKEDRQVMRSTYYWMDYYMKTPSEKGHRASMNIIWNKMNDLKPDYWIHMEDDFLFYHSMNYIEKAIAALKHQACISNGIKQIVFNRNYAETIDNYKTIGHLHSTVPGIVVHDHKPNESITHYQNSHYWPHYSFRPAMTSVKATLKLGNFDSSNQFFERDYADKWTKANYKTAFFDRITHRHIGRLTSEINSGTVKNAYELNGEAQFAAQDHGKAYKPTNIKVLNLERRLDRKAAMVIQMKEAGLHDFSFYKAVDGNELDSTQELKTLFAGNDFGNRRGVIGCAMSHLKMWRELLEDKTNTYYVIFEDDFSLVEKFKEKFDSLTEEFIKNDVIFLGYHMFDKKRKEVKDIYDISGDQIKVMPLNKDLYIGGTFSYSINKDGAKKLVDYIDQNGIKHGIDYVMKILPGLNSCELQPLLVRSEWNEAGNGKTVDTDIQTNYKALDFTKTLEDQFIFIPRMDQIGSDLYYHRGLSVIECMKKALNDPKCQGFNTLGFFKSNIDKLSGSIYFGEKDGLYIRGVEPPQPPLAEAVAEAVAGVGVVVAEAVAEAVAEVGVVVAVAENASAESSLKVPAPLYVRVSCNWCSSEQLCKEWSIMKPPNSRIELISMDDKEKGADAPLVIINQPQHGTPLNDPKNTIVFQMEPWIEDPKKNWGVKTWGEWAKPDPQKFLKVFAHKSHLNNVQWHIDYPFYTKPVDNTGKLNKIASVVSAKNFDNGHKYRTNFIKCMESITNKEMASMIDVWGRENYHHFKNYKGTIKDDYKFNVFANYKYSFSAENNWEENYATEKIWEPILCESLCFYWGCPNLEDYLHPMAFVRLPIEHPSIAIDIIHQAITEDWWSQRIGIIKQMKEKILTQLGFYPLLQKTLEDATA